MSEIRRPLEVLRIEQPCPADWEKMEGDVRRRFCKGCQKYVHNLSAMARSEAEELVCQSAGEICIRYARTPDGNVVTVDYAGEERQERRRGWRFWSGVGLAGAFLAGVGQAFWSTRSPSGFGTVMGAPSPMTAPATLPTTSPSTTQPTTRRSQQAARAKSDSPRAH